MLITNKWPEIPALAPDPDHFPAAAAAEQVRTSWHDIEATSSEWAWLEPLFPDLVASAERTESLDEPGDAEADVEDEDVAEPVIDDRAEEAPGASVAQRRAPRRPRGKQMAIMAGAFGVSAAVVAVLAAILMGGAEDVSSAQAPADTSTSTVHAGQAPADSCPEVTEGITTAGDGAGDQKSGAGAILAWNYRYYVARSARAAKAVTDAGAVATEADLQAAIDAVPEGTTHCVQITDRGQGLYAVRLTVSNETAPIRQLVRTKEVEGRWLIESFRKDGS